MKTPGPPRSSKDRDKDEESAPTDQMARFRRAAKATISADPKKVRALEAKSRKPRDG